MKVTFFSKAFSGDLHGRPSQPELSRWAAATQKAPPTWTVPPATGDPEKIEEVSQQTKWKSVGKCMEKLRFPVKTPEFHRQELGFHVNRETALTNKFERAQTQYVWFLPTNIRAELKKYNKKDSGKSWQVMIAGHMCNEEN